MCSTTQGFDEKLFSATNQYVELLNSFIFLDKAKLLDNSEENELIFSEGKVNSVTYVVIS